MLCFTGSALRLLVSVLMNRRMCELVGVLWLGVSAVACATQKAPRAPEIPNPDKTTAKSQAIEWIADDFEAARLDARTHQRPLLIDFWANWCHSCINMKHTVLVDPELSSLKDGFTWAALDTENPVNAAVLKRYPPLSWPTFFVLDPESGAAIARFSGSATLAQFRGFLEQAQQDFRDSGGAKGPAQILVRADNAMQAGDRQGARTAYMQALAEGGPAWPRRHDVQVLALRTFEGESDAPACLEFARSTLADQGPQPSSAEYFYFAHRCLAPTVTQPQVQVFLKSALHSMEQILTEHQQTMPPDDQSTLLAQMRLYAESLGQAQQARGFALVQREILDKAANSASTPYEASMYNWPREEVYVYLGQGESLVSVLKQSEADLPGHYDPPYRLAWLLHKLGENQEALAAAKRARQLVEGPRRSRVEELIESIQGQLSP